MDTYGFHGDTFSGGFGDFHPAKRRQSYGLPYSAPDNFGLKQQASPFASIYDTRFKVVFTNG